MCEVMAVAWKEPEPFATVLPWAMALERFGVAGFGWGVAWKEEGGQVRRYRNPSSLEEDTEGAAKLTGVHSRRFLIHLRRPSRLSTVQEADSQPFVDERRGFAFCHNGLFERADALRSRYAGRLQGRADSEVGFCYLQDRLDQRASPREALVQTLQELGGTGNLGYLGSDGSLLLLAAHPNNAMWRFRTPGASSIAVTALHSDDESVFERLFPDATDRRKIVQSVTVVGDPAPGPQRRAAS
jgi:predicted glutamine amidotransferase